MNKTLSYILVGGASALIGGIAGYIFCKKKLQDKYDEAVTEAINKELEKIRKARRKETTPNDIDDKIKNNRYANFYIKEAKKVIYEMFPNETLSEYKVVLVANCLLECHEQSLDEIATSDKLNELFASFESPQDDIPEEDLGTSYEEDNIQAVMDDYASHPPHVISEEEYASLPPAFDFLTYKYFEDDILIDDGDDEIITNVEEVVGDALVQFGDNDMVYVINGKQAMAIEIIRMNCTYQAWSGLGDA